MNRQHSFKSAISYTPRLTLLASLLIILPGCEKPAQIEAPSEPVDYRVQVVQLKSASERSQKVFTGKLQSTKSAAVSFRVPGTLQKILVKTGDTVKKGQLLAELDPHDYKVALEELEARALEAKSALKLAKIELARVQQAIDDNAIASVNLDRAISGFERSEAAVKVVDQNIRRAQDTINYTQLRAPFNGVIARSNYDQFEQILPGVEAFTVHEPTQLEVSVDVPENLIHQFEHHQKAEISWYNSATKLTGLATEIGSLPHPIKQTYTVTFNVDALSLLEKEMHVLPGKAVTLTTQLGELSSDFCLPYSAIVGNASAQHVYTVVNKKTVQKEVKITALAADTACVEADLNANDYVVVSGAAYLKPNQSIASMQVKTFEVSHVQYR